MRLLHVISTLNPEFGGPVEAVKQLGLSFRGKGVSVEVAVCKDLPNAPWVQSYPLRVHALGPALGYYGYTLKLAQWLELHGRDYDIWVLNGLWQCQSLAARVAWRMGQPYFVYAHGMLDPWNRRAAPLKYLKKLVYWLAHERRVLQRAEAVCFTAAEEARLARTFLPLSRWNEFVPGAGIGSPPPPRDAAAEELLERFPLLRGKRVWTFLGRLHSKKALHLLIPAFARVTRDVPEIVLLVAGPGDAAYIARLTNLVKAHGLESRVQFTGPVYGDEKWACFRASELFLLPSHQENFGIAIAEALATHVPVCISDRVNIWQEVKDSGAGLVCQDNEPSIENALGEWIALSSDERQDYRARARACYERYFDVGGVTDRLLERFRSTRRRG